MVRIKNISTTLMKSIFCSTRKSYKTYFQTLDKLSIDDLVWLKSRDALKASFLEHLIAKYPQRIKLVKVHDGENNLLFFPLETIQINLSELYEQKPGLLNSIGQKILSMCTFKIAHPSYSLLYDFDFSIANTDIVVASEKYSLMIKALESVAKELDINILTVPVGLHRSHTLEKVIQKEKFELPVQDFTMELNLEPSWKCFADYTNDLKRKYNKRAIAIRKKAEPLSIKSLGANELVQYQDRINQLYAQVIKKQKFIAGTAPQEHFIDLKNIYSDRFIFEAVFDPHGEMMAFISYFVESEQLQIHYVGIDYNSNEKYDLYFNLLFRAIEQGIERQKSNINFGRTSLDAKASLGANPKYRNTYVKTYGLSKLIKKCVAYHIAKLENNSWKLRKPFKNDASVLEEAS